MEAKKFQLKNTELSEKQIEEHLKLYQGYVKKSDEIREKFGKADWEDANAVQSEIRNLILGETFANNGVRLHEAYFENISGKQEIYGAIKELIIEKFKSLDKFNKRLTSFALSVRGWVVFAWDYETNRLRLFGTDQHDIAIWNAVPLIVLDMYEHAYFLDFGTNKKAYINWFLNHINWEIVSVRANKFAIMTPRKTEFEIDKIFVNRWSPRAMSGEKISDEELMSLFEAAKWAPSSYNSQPWRFVYAKRNTKEWNKIFNLLIDFNKIWTKNASALIVVLSRKNFEHNDQPSVTHSFDTGAAWENLALHGSLKGLVIHGMSGFDYEKARKELHVPENYNVEMIFAVGKKGKKENLPEDMQKIEMPSDRKKISEFVFEGEFKNRK